MIPNVFTLLNSKKNESETHIYMYETLYLRSSFLFNHVVEMKILTGIQAKLVFILLKAFFLILFKVLKSSRIFLASLQNDSATKPIFKIENI